MNNQTVRSMISKAVQNEKRINPKSLMLELCQQHPITREMIYDVMWDMIDNSDYCIVFDRDEEDIYLTNQDDQGIDLTDVAENDLRLPDTFWSIADNGQLVVDCPFCNETLCLDDEHYEAKNPFSSSDADNQPAFNVPGEHMDRNCDVQLDTELMDGPGSNT